MRTSETKIVSGVTTLADLRELVASLEDWPGESRVTLKEAKGFSQLDRGEASVTVTRTMGAKA